MTTAVELAIGNPLILAYEKLFNTNAPTPELQSERDGLRQQFGQLFKGTREHFDGCDQVKSSQLLAERDDVGEQAKAILRQINELQQKSGLVTSLQSRLQFNVETAERKLREFVPCNRTISTLEQIKASEDQEIELRKAVSQCKQAMSNNHRSILEGVYGLNKLQQQYHSLAAREEKIAEELEELQTPAEQRKPRSSIVWEVGGSTFGWQRP